MNLKKILIVLGACVAALVLYKIFKALFPFIIIAAMVGGFYYYAQKQKWFD